MTDFPRHARQGAWLRVGVLFVLGYALLLLLLSGVRPLWLDEVMQIDGVSRESWRDVLECVLQNPGGAPLGYLGQHWVVSIAGTGLTAARLLSVFAGAGSLVLLAVVCKQLGMRRAAIVMTVCLWAVCPLAVRYSLEGRPYMLALCFGLGAVAAQLQLVRTGKIRWALVLAVCLAAAVYSQSFAVFAALGFSLCVLWQDRRVRLAAPTAAAYAVAGLSFLPWYLAAQAEWRATIVAQGLSEFAWKPSLLVLVRECMGDGYPAAVPACCWRRRAWWRSQEARRGIGGCPLWLRLYRE